MRIPTAQHKKTCSNFNNTTYINLEKYEKAYKARAHMKTSGHVLKHTKNSTTCWTLINRLQFQRGGGTNQRKYLHNPVKGSIEHKHKQREATINGFKTSELMLASEVPC